MAKRALSGPNFASKAFRPYAIAIGQVTLASNHLHEMLGLLFAVVMQSPGDDIKRSLLVWHSAGLDRPKRQMLRAATQEPSARALARRPSLMPDITWLLDRADELEEVRNNSIHGPLFLMQSAPAHADGPGSPPLPPDTMPGNPTELVTALHKSGLLAELKWCRDTATILTRYSVSMGFGLLHSKKPWPSRPTLPVRRVRKSA